MSLNRDDQKDEIEALEAILGPNSLSIISDYMYEVKIGKSEREGVSLTVTYPGTYPSDSIPNFDISSPFMGSEGKAMLKDNLVSIATENIGMPCVYMLIQAIEEFLEAMHPEKELREEVNNDAAVVGDNVIVRENCPEIHTGDSIEDRKSVFQGHFAYVAEDNDVRRVIDQLMTNRKIANATHNMWAYRIKGPKGYLKDCDDDGEANAGSRLLHLLDILGADKHLVIVTRWYGGIHLGPDRFKHISNAARQAIECAGALPGQKKGDKKQITKQKAR